MRLGTKLIIGLVSALVVIMLGHGYLSLRQDRENMTREMRVGMIGLARTVRVALQHAYGDEGNLRASQSLIDGIGRPGNIHGLVIYDRAGKRAAISVSLTDRGSVPNLDPAPVLNIDPGPTLTDGESREGYIEHPAHPVYFRIEPIMDSQSHLAGAVVVGRRGLGLPDVLESRRDRILVTTGTLIVVMSLSILIIVRRNISRPIELLIERIRNVGIGPWDRRVPVEGNNEISLLAREFNQMCERLQDLYASLAREKLDRVGLERNLRQSEKLASVGQLAAGLAHEIGTPLNIIGGRADFLLRRQRSAAEISDNLQTIHSQIDRIAGIVRQLLEFSRRREPAIRAVELKPLIEKIASLLEHKIAERKVSVDYQIPAGLPCIAGDPDQLQQVFLNLFLNALHALPPNGQIRIRAKLVENGAVSIPVEDAQRGLQVEFEDNGTGIPAHQIGQVFDPFFTTKDVGEGTGLGLSVSYGIIKDHGGEIRVDSQVGQFTRFTIFLPSQLDLSAKPEAVIIQ
jgi:signal transduction histidine kinase